MLRRYALLAPLLLSITAASHATERQLTPLEVKTVQQRAANNDLQAQLELADRYYKGDGLKQDYAQAAHWYKKLAETGVANAQLTLGLMYAKGDGIKQDDAQAIHWLMQAAEQRIPTAQYLLGIANAEGRGVKQDLVKAYMWFEIAAAMDNENAIDARQTLEKKLTANEVAMGDQLATEWWMRFHN